MDPRAERTRGSALAAAQGLLIGEGLDAVTHLRVAEVAQLGRRSLYRHWPDRRSLLHDVLAQTSAPPIPASTDLRTSIEQHLEALERALIDGPLALIISALHERSVHDPEFDRLREELVAAGCAPLEDRLRAARRAGELPRRLDIAAAVAELEGPVFHAALLHRRALGRRARVRVVEAFLSQAVE